MRTSAFVAAPLVAMAAAQSSAANETVCILHLISHYHENLTCLAVCPQHHPHLFHRALHQRLHFIPHPDQLSRCCDRHSQPCNRRRYCRH